MSEDRVRVVVEDHVARVSLSRPEKRNALDFAMFQGIADAAESLSGEADLRAVVLSGEGAAFSAGLDLGSLMNDPQAIEGLLMRKDSELANLAQRVCWAWRQLPVPVVAALQGEVFGGGLQIALGADIRIAAPDARLSVMEIRWGLVPDMAGSRVLRDIVGYDVAMDLSLTGRIVDGTEALRLGLVTRLADDPGAEAVEMATEIAGRSPDAIRAVKALLHKAPRVDDARGLMLETELQMQLLGGRNQMEAARAGLDKRAPVFRPASIKLEE